MSSSFPTIVAIDDEEFNLFLFQELAKEIGFSIKGFVDPKEGLAFIESNQTDILFVDYMMPDIDGLEVIKRVHSIDPSVLIIMITAAGENRALKLKALEYGASEFLTKPIDGIEFQIRLKNLVSLKRAHNVLKDFNKVLKEEVKRATQEIVERELETIQSLSKAAEYKDRETGNHILRVAHYSKIVAKGYGFTEEDQDMIFFSSPLHDIGKVGIPDSILIKPGKLTKEEFELMKKHTIIGYNIMHKSKNKYLKTGAVIALTHHEKFDGTGYPKGLKGEEIPIMGRIVAIADVFDALTSVRPYKPAWPIEKAFDLISEERGKHFDPKLAEIFLNNKEKIEEIFQKFKDE